MLEKFRTYQLSVKFYHRAQRLSLPRHLKEQMNRASSSVCLNLAEGSGKMTLNDKRKFYSISLGSLRECQAILDLSSNTNPELIQLASYVGACIFKLCRPC
ncbi:MAG: four helix bundle protein [Bacteriovoracaceae bacterium]|nr:four helix bundle protein [Bacteriovoracaceae bacterium]